MLNDAKKKKKVKPAIKNQYRICYERQDKS